MNICPWTLLEWKIHDYVNRPDDDLFFEILNFLKENSSHKNFWIKLFHLSESGESSHVRHINLIKYLENENEQLYSIIESNEQKKTSK